MVGRASEPAGPGLLLAAAVAAAVLGGWLLTGPAPTDPAAVSPPAGADSLQTPTAPPPPSALTGQPPVAPASPAAPTPAPTSASTATPSSPLPADPTPAPSLPVGTFSLDGPLARDPDTDVLAADLTDQQLQDLLEQASRPLSPPPVTASAQQAGWAAIRRQLEQQQWRQLHRQAAIVQQSDLTQQQPAQVTVTVLWSGTATGGLQVERRRATVTLIRTASGWQPSS